MNKKNSSRNSSRNSIRNSSWNYNWAHKHYHSVEYIYNAIIIDDIWWVSPHFSTADNSSFSHSRIGIFQPCNKENKLEGLQKQFRPNVLVLKLGGLSQSQRLENIFLGLLTDDLDQLDRDFFCPLSKNLVWPCLSICFVHKEICIIISGVCKNTGSSVLT